MKSSIQILTKYKITILICLVLTIFFFLWTKESNAATVAYTYDNLNRLTKVDYDNGIIEEYTYDPVGNRLSLIISEPDSDNDGLLDSLENTTCTDPFDADSDDDGISDGVEDANHNGVVDLGETDPCLADTDGDGIQDGTELGYILADIGPDTDTDVFQPDLDPSTTTDPLNSDTDGDGLSDGQEDTNHNGMFDPGELDPNHLHGDVDGDSDTDLADAILALQVMAGITPSTTVYKEADVNGDGKIGIEEVLYILQEVFGVR